MTDSDLIAAYLAKNADVTVPEGMRTTTPREMRGAVRGEAIATQRQRVAQRAEASHYRAVGTRLQGNADATTEQWQDAGNRMVTDHAGREFWMNAEGEWL